MNLRHLFNSLCCCLLFILRQNRIYTNGLNQTTLTQAQIRPHVGHQIGQSQVPDQYVIVFFDDFQRRSVLYTIFKMPVHHGKPVLDRAFQIVRDHVSRQNVMDPFVLVKVEHDPTSSPLAFERVHFEPVHNMERMIRDPSKEKNKIVSSYTKTRCNLTNFS